MFFKSFLLCFLAFATTISGEEPVANDNGSAAKVVDYKPQIKGLSDKINSLESSIEASNTYAKNAKNSIDSNTKQQLDSFGTKLANVEKNTLDCDNKMTAMDKTLSNQKVDVTRESKTMNDKIDKFGINLQSIEAMTRDSLKLAQESVTAVNEMKKKNNNEKKTPAIDLSQYVSIKDFNDLKSEISSLKSLLSEHNNNHDSHSSEFVLIKEELSNFQQHHETSHLKLTANSENVSKEINLLRNENKELKKLNNEMTSKLSANEKKSQEKATKSKLKQLETMVTRVDTTVKRLDDQMDSVTQECVNLEDMVHHVQTQTIGAMIETNLNKCKALLEDAFQFSKEKGAVCLEFAKEKYEKWFKVLEKKVLLLKKDIENYDYSWVTDEKNWKALGSYIVHVCETASDYTTVQVIPAVQKQSTQAANQIRDFVVNFYSNRRNNQVYNEASFLILPLFKQWEAFPQEYHLVTLDILMAFFIFLAILLSWAMVLSVCNCLCPKIKPKPVKIHDKDGIRLSSKPVITNKDNLANGKPSKVEKVGKKSRKHKKHSKVETE